MILFSKKQTPAIILGIILVAMGLMAWYGIVPLKRAIWNRMNDIQKFYTSRENRERQIGRLPDLQGQFEAIKADEETLAILLTEDRIVDFIKTLEALAKETGTEISIKSKDGAAAAKQKKAPAKPADGSEGESASGKRTTASIIESLPSDSYLRLGISVAGEYEDIVTFLHKMETLPVALDVIGVEMYPRDNDERSRPVSAGSGVNPFMLTPSGSSAVSGGASGENPAQPEKLLPLEAVFDTVVYVDKKE